MSKCCIRKCNSDSRRKNQKISFFSVPKNEEIKKKWFDIIGAKNIKPGRNLKICSNHFEEKSVNRTLDVVRLKDDVVPTLFPFTSSSAQLMAELSKKSDNTGNKSAISKVNNSRVCAPVDGEYLIQEPCPTMSMSAVDPLLEVKQESPDEALSANEEESLMNPSQTPPKVELSNETGNTETTSPLRKYLRMKTVKVNRIYTGKLPTNAKKMVIHLPKNTERSMMVLEAAKPEIRVHKLTKQLQNSRKKIKILNQRCRRLLRKVQTYRNTIEELKNLHGS